MAKTLIIITLIYYLLKGLIYLLLWQGTYKVEEQARARKNAKKKKRDLEEEIWHPEQDSE